MSKSYLSTQFQPRKEIYLGLMRGWRTLRVRLAQKISVGAFDTYKDIDSYSVFLYGVNVP